MRAQGKKQKERSDGTEARKLLYVQHRGREKGEKGRG